MVPKISVIVGGSFGAGNYAMCGKAYDPRFIFAWPTARYAVMSGDSAANTLVEIRIRQLERGGTQLSEEEKQELIASIKATYEEQTDLPVRGGTTLGGRDYRSGANAGGAADGAGGGGAESRGGEIQSRHPTNVTG